MPKETILMTELPANRQVNVVLIWLTEEDDLYQVFLQLRDTITPDGAIWAVIPKKTGRKKTGVTFSQVQSAALKTIDLVDNKVASFSENEYGIRFVIRKAKRGERQKPSLLEGL
jgi:hypothetical protein